MTSIFPKLFRKLRDFHFRQLLIPVLSVLTCFALVFLFRYATDPYDCRILEGVSIDGIQLGGLTKAEARRTLKAAAEETILSQPLTVTLPEEVWNLDPGDLKLNIRKAIDAAYAVGRKTDVNEKVFTLEPFLRIPEDSLRTRLDTYAQTYNTELTPPQYRLTGDSPDLTEAGFDPDFPCQTVLVTMGTPKSHLDTEAARNRILQTYYHGISAEPGSYRVELEMAMDQLPDYPDWEAMYTEFSKQAVDAYADLQTYRIIPAVYGQSFDWQTIEAKQSDYNWGSTVSIPLQYEAPEVLSDAVPFRDILGHCETKHTDDENRNTNLRLVCEILNGYILNPGEEFSYNGVIGERTEERGFKAAGAYSGTRLVKDIGGGVCQGSSTLYNCVLLADLEVTERVCHGLLVNYLPIGLDAAVNWSTKTDFKFRNNFHFPVQIQAKLEGGYMKMQIVGVDEKDYYVEMRSGRSDEEYRIYSNSYKYKFDKETGEQLSRELEARSSYMYFSD